MPGVLSKAVGFGITLGSALVKLPQLYNVLRHDSVRGLSLGMYVLETFTQSVNCLYALANGFPFSTYGENVFLGLPNLVILWVFARQREKKEPGARRRFVTQLAAFALGCVLLLRAHRKQPRILETLQGLTIPLYVASRVPQVLKIARERSAGHLSAVTFAANLLGSVGRLYTTKHELGGDRVLVTGFIVSIALNALLVAQILYFGPGAEGASAAARKLRHDE